MLTNFLPAGGNDDFTLYAIAYDGSGHRVELGQKNITCDNAHSIKPFGTIDTPAQGGQASGADFLNFGWALTPQPKYIPTDGSTIWVWVDGVPLGHPVYNNYRSDIAALFPGYANSDGAVGYYYLDTTAYENGVHNIAWSVEDNEGEVNGIGSRFFEVQNTGGAPAGAVHIDVSTLQNDFSGSLRPRILGIKRGYKVNGRKSGTEEAVILRKQGTASMLETLRKREDGVYEIRIEELERIEIHFRCQEGSRLIGWGESTSKPLPLGSTIDEEKGIFYWSLGPGFLREHVLHFAAMDGQFISSPVEVVVHILPKRFQ